MFANNIIRILDVIIISGDYHMKVVVIGGTGHIGTYLIPRLIEDGHKVICMSLGDRQPYRDHIAWQKVTEVTINRQEEEKKGKFGKRVLEYNPDVVIDCICFTMESAVHLTEALKGKIQHLLHIGTLWVLGTSVEVPTTEDQPRNPIEEYGKQKAEIESYLLKEHSVRGFPVTLFHPGHLVGVGWEPINPLGNYNPEIFSVLAQGKELALPNFGLELLHHVHVDDLAQALVRSIHCRNRAVGESFNVVASKAITMKGFAEKVASWFGKEANLRFLPWDQWKETVSQEDADWTYRHIMHNTNASITKAQTLLDYQPRYSIVQAVHESVQWLIEKSVVKI